MKIKGYLLLIPLLLVLLVGFAMAQYFGGIYVDKGFINGNKYLSMKEELRIPYVCGVRDGMLFANILMSKDHSSKDSISAITQYTQNMPGSQVTAIVNKYLKDNPERWNHPINFLIFEALMDSILKSNKKK